jgi:hypothetical protein
MNGSSSIRQVAGAAVLFVAVSWALSAFAAWPWQAAREDAARLRLSLRHVTAFAEQGAALSPDELAKLPPHMRPTDGTTRTTRRRADALLSLSVDGRTIVERRYRPTGYRNDGPVHAYDEVDLPAGTHDVRVTLVEATGGHADAPAYTFDQRITIPARRTPLLQFHDRAWQLHSAR